MPSASRDGSQDSEDCEKELIEAVSEVIDDPPDAKDRKSVLISVDGFIIITEFCERLAYYGFAGSLVLFFQTQLGFSNAVADVQYSYWSSACYVTPLIGGYIADTYLGRYRAILVFSIIYCVGLALVVLGAIPGKVSAAVVFSGMYIIAVGTGGIKPNVSTLGADQFDDRYSQDRREKESFFNWFYWAINLGALISYTLVAYVCQYGLAGLGGAPWGFFDGYMIPTIMMGVAVFTFVAGTPRYKIPQPSGSILATTLSILCQASYKGLESVAAVVTRNPTLDSSKVWLGSGAVHFLDRAKAVFGGSYTTTQVECVKLVTRLLPFLFAMIPYWGVYSQMSTAFQNQGCQMNLFIGTAPVPVSALNIFDTLAILMLLPLFDRIIYPYFSSTAPLSMLKKIGAGFIFALLSMVVAAVIENYRIQLSPPEGDYYDEAARNNISPCQNIDDYSPYVYQQYVAGLSAVQAAYCSQTCDTYYTVNSQQFLNATCISCNTIPQMSKMSVFWQIPQFMLIGISEILSSITSLEFFYSQAPSSMRSVSQAFNLLTSSLGSFIVIPLIYIVNSNPNDEWVPVNLNEGHLVYYFLLLAALMILNQIYFWYISKEYEYKTNAELQITDEDFMRNTHQSVETKVEDIYIDPHTGVWTHPNPTTGQWSHVSGNSSSLLFGLSSSQISGSQSGDLAMTTALLDHVEENDSGFESKHDRFH